MKVFREVGWTLSLYDHPTILNHFTNCASVVSESVQHRLQENNRFIHWAGVTEAFQMFFCHARSSARFFCGRYFVPSKVHFNEVKFSLHYSRSGK